jgi:DNA-binding response OmpR family regulator
MRGNPPPSPESEKLRLLIIDDEPDVCSALTNTLRREGYFAEEATSGQQALILLQRDSYDVMILDMQMSGMSGMDVMRHVRQLYPELSIVILTGHATLDNAIAAAKSEQVVDYLLKPAKNQEIIDAVTRALQKRTERLRQKRLVEAAGQVLDAMRQSETSSSPAPTSEVSTAPVETTQEGSIHVPPLRLDRKRRLVTVEDNPASPIKLTKGETDVVVSLMASPNRVLSCRELVFAAWGYDTDETEAVSIIRPYISRLRRKIAAVIKEPQLIRTVRGYGYYFAPSEE